MIQAVAERLHSAGVQHLIDAYCGVGFFSLSLADKVQRFTGVEVDKRAIEASKKKRGNHGA